eukprot:15344973-Ditylum_brightwellii.AAC.1
MPANILPHAAPTYKKPCHTRNICTNPPTPTPPGQQTNPQILWALLQQAITPVQKQITDVWPTGQIRALQRACAVNNNNALPATWFILASANTKQQHSKLQDECDDWADILGYPQLTITPGILNLVLNNTFMGRDSDTLTDGISAFLFPLVSAKDAATTDNLNNLFDALHSC